MAGTSSAKKQLDLLEAASSGYSASDIEVLEGLDPVRRRPGMYIGGTDERAFHHLAAEIIDNSMDEAVAGHAKFIEVVLKEDGSLSVKDDGRGIPIDRHPQFPDKSALEVIFTTLHSGGKFGGKAYETSGGLHGVGSSVVNALSQWLEVDVIRSNELYRQRYEQGVPKTALEKVGSVKGRGTTVSFKPDFEIFGKELHFKPHKLYQMIRSKAYLFRGVKIIWKCHPSLIQDDTPAESIFHFPNGLTDFLAEQVQNQDTVTTEPFTGQTSFSDRVGSVEWAIHWLPDSNQFTSTYCNTIPTPQGGTHEQGLRQALAKGLRQYATLKNHKKVGIITTEDVMTSCSYLLSLFMREPQFQGQTKEKLASNDITSSVEKAIKDHFEQWLVASPSQADILLEYVIEQAEIRLKKKQDKDVQRSSATRRLRLPGKLADCTIQTAEGTEIFLVEGDSAGGSAKQARNRNTQAILPLRGKILNVASATSDKLRANQELSDLSLALGCGLGKQFSASDLRYEKVVIMTDADVDGAHIASLLMTFFYREMPDLIKNGNLYLAVPPLYRLSHGGKTHYARDDKHRQELLKTVFKNKQNVEMGRFKGLGEMMPAQLRDTTMHPKNRTLIRLLIAETEAETTEQLVDHLMGRKPELRYQYIVQNAVFADDLDV